MMKSRETMTTATYYTMQFNDIKFDLYVHQRNYNHCSCYVTKLSHQASSLSINKSKPQLKKHELQLQLKFKICLQPNVDPCIYPLCNRKFLCLQNKQKSTHEKIKT